jgi:putative membrane protein
MTTPLKHLGYLFLSGLLVTAMACGGDGADDAAHDDDTATMTTADAPPPAAPADGGMAGGDTMGTGTAMANTGNPDQDFATNAAAMNLAEIRAHQTAVDRATNAEVKKHAQHMLTDHKQMDADMKSLAAKKNITLPTEPRQDKVQMQDQMNQSKQGKEWDAAYVAAQVQDHQEAIALFESGEKSVQDADLKKLITSTLPKLRSHLKMVQDAQAKLK